MGYDCYVRSPREPKPELPHGFSTEQERDAWYQDRIEWEDRTHGYFRRSMGGGAGLADALIAMGMGFEAEKWVPIPPFPMAEEYGVEYDEWQDDGGRWHDGYKGDRAKEYEADLAEHLRWHGPEIPGIPIHKICTTNDGWVVTREECRAALVLYDAAIVSGREHPDAFRDDFIPFLIAAAAADGFEVF
jgi:hypothetical protein